MRARQLADAPAGGADWRDASAPLAARVRALLDQLTVDEKIAQLDATTHPTGGVDRLGVPAFQGWNGARMHEQTMRVSCLMTSSTYLFSDDHPFGGIHHLNTQARSGWVCTLRMGAICWHMLLNQSSRNYNRGS